MNSKISIVLPVYNGAVRVNKSIESIISQSYKNWELIIVNDCSTDNTSSIIREYTARDTRIKVIDNPTNQKLPRSLNIGFEQAAGDYLTWTSDDNRYHSDALYVMADVLDNNPEIDLVYSDYNVVDIDGNFIREEIKESPDSIRFGSIVGACFLYRNSLAEKAGIYNADLFLAEDYEFFLRCYMHGSFYHLNKILYDYGMHDNSLTSTRYHDILRQTYKVMDMHFDYLYSSCNTINEKHRLFFSMLFCISDDSKKRATLNRFYKLDRSFRFAYFKRQVKNALKKLLRI
ncbi:MAG: glycosyltransferase [Lachnospiraceae bacterium]|nr:glycosyltransferase [Lachnospiraceae bacterium]